MINQPTPEQIAKLPAWAREHIKGLQRQRDSAVRALDEYVTTATPSPFYTDDMECTGEKSGPTTRRRYIQATTICVEWRGISLRVDAHEYGNQGDGIRIGWHSKHLGEAAFIPTSFQAARIISKADMR